MKGALEFETIIILIILIVVMVLVILFFTTNFGRGTQPVNQVTNTEQNITNTTVIPMINNMSNT